MNERFISSIHSQPACSLVLSSAQRSPRYTLSPSQGDRRTSPRVAWPVGERRRKNGGETSGAELSPVLRRSTFSPSQSSLAYRRVLLVCSCGGKGGGSLCTRLALNLRCSERSPINSLLCSSCQFLVLEKRRIRAQLRCKVIVSEWRTERRKEVTAERRIAEKKVEPCRDK